MAAEQRVRKDTKSRGCAPKARSRGFCFTIYGGGPIDISGIDPSDEQTRATLVRVTEQIAVDTGHDFVRAGYEICPKTKRPHLQCYSYCANARGFETVRRKLQKRGYKFHLEPMHGTIIQNEVYTSKDGFYHAIGQLPSQGARTDLSTIRDDISANGYDEKRIADEYFNQWCIYRRSFLRYAELLWGRRNERTRTMWLFGPSGSGKSTAAQKIGGENAYWMFDLRGHWWDNLNFSEAIIADDITPGAMETRTFIRLADRFPLRVQTKGGSTEFRGGIIIFTSNFDPLKVFKTESREQETAVLRRIDVLSYIERGCEPAEIEPYEEFERTSHLEKTYDFIQVNSSKLKYND